jgi:hypothetical protein
MRRHSLLLTAALAATAGALLPLVGPASPSAANSVSICFPVLDTPVQYYGTFGAPRGGGTRTHEGEDIMGQAMFRIVAPVDGVIYSGGNGRDGIRWSGTGDTEHSLRMRGDDGYVYAFLHMNNDTPGADTRGVDAGDGMAAYDQVFGPGIVPGARVHAGQLLGYMGDSGNAGEGNDHLHFEMRTPSNPSSPWSSTAFDPYDSLQASRRCDLPNPVVDLGGVAASDPDAAAVAGSRQVDLVVRGTDDQTYTRTYDGFAWSPWATLGGVARSAPALVAPSPGTLTVFVRGTDDALWTRTRTGGAWGGWSSLGGVLTGDPDAASFGRSEVAVVVRGTDGAIWQQRLVGGTWTGWGTLGGQTSTPPAVAAPTATRYEVFARGTDDGLWGMPVTGGQAGGWAGLGGVLTSPPEATAEGGTSHVAVLGSDDRVWHRRLDGQSPWTLVTAQQGAGGVALASWGTGRVDLVFVAKDDRSLLHTWWDPSGW